MATGLKMNELCRCFSLDHNRIERLEAARERHAEKRLQHLQLTLDPIKAKQNGTLAKLEKLVSKEICRSASEKKALAVEFRHMESGPHEEDMEFLDKQTKAEKLFKHFHRKLTDQNDDNSEFSVDTLSKIGED